MKRIVPEKIGKFIKKISPKQIKVVSIVLSIVAVLALVVTAVVVSGVFPLQKEQKEVAVEEPEQVEPEVYEVKETEREKSYFNEEVLQTITDSGEYVKKALEERPATIDVPDAELSEFVSIEKCLITDGGVIEVTATSKNLPKSDDKYYYLFDAATYEDGIAEDSSPIYKAYKDRELVLKADLNKGTTDSRLFKKFIVAIKKDDGFKAVSHASYITNPERIASFNYAGMGQSSKKGLLVDPSRLGELDDLGVKYATYNIPLNRLLTPSAAGSVGYSYNGVTYYFNAAILDQYDYLFRTLNSKGIDIAAIILNDASPANFPELTYPSARSGSTAPYYMFNASDSSGVNGIAAVATFLANRYSGSGRGNVSMWIIGNEVNARKEWNYMPQVDLESYTAAYTRAFRVFYNAIKSVNAGAKVYIPIDQQWDRNLGGNPDYDGKDMLDTFAASLKNYGDINWGLAHHPYSVPLTNTAFWNGSKYVSDSMNSSFITMKNINVLTDYMSQAALLNSEGQVRSIILSEVGYSSTAGDATQAAAIAYAYSKVAANSKIDAIMFSRQTDAGEEIAQGLALGLSSPGGGHKQAYTVFKYMDTAQREEYIAFARSIVGVNF